jgi:hypothetical protein
MMNVPDSVIIGKSPMKTVCSRISPVSLLTKRTVIESGPGRSGPSPALLDRELRLAELVLAELDGERAGVVLDRRDVVDRLPESPSFRNQSKDSRWLSNQVWGGLNPEDGCFETRKKTCARVAKQD